MIRGVNQVVLHVEDQEEAKRFWVDMLGFTLAEDSPYGEERWLSVVSPDGATKLVLSRRAPGWTPQDVRDGIPHSNVIFYTDDVEGTYRELTDKGVNFPDPSSTIQKSGRPPLATPLTSATSGPSACFELCSPTKQFFGWWSMFEDPDGTRYALGQKWGSDQD
jgi:lactoylglutathione lyase